MSPGSFPFDKLRVRISSFDRALSKIPCKPFWNPRTAAAGVPDARGLVLRVAGWRCRGPQRRAGFARDGVEVPSAASSPQAQLTELASTILEAAFCVAGPYQRAVG